MRLLIQIKEETQVTDRRKVNNNPQHEYYTEPLFLNYVLQILNIILIVNSCVSVCTLLCISRVVL